MSVDGASGRRGTSARVSCCSARCGSGEPAEREATLLSPPGSGVRPALPAVLPHGKNEVGSDLGGPAASVIIRAGRGHKTPVS